MARTLKHKSGALSSREPRMDLIPYSALVRLSRRYEKGLRRYGKDNWRNGLTSPSYVVERLSHTINHCYHLIDQIEGRRPWGDDDHAAAIMWGGAFAVAATEPGVDRTPVQVFPDSAGLVPAHPIHEVKSE
jgi:hypothetical protein